MMQLYISADFTEKCVSCDKEMDFFLKSFYLFIHVFTFGSAGSRLLHRLFSSSSEVAALHCAARASPVVVPLQQSTGLQGPRVAVVGAPGLRAQAQHLWRMGLAALWHVGVSRIWDGVHVSSTGRWILYHRATGKPQTSYVKIQFAGSLQ